MTSSVLPAVRGSATHRRYSCTVFIVHLVGHARRIQRQWIFIVLDHWAPVRADRAWGGQAAEATPGQAARSCLIRSAMRSATMIVIFVFAHGIDGIDGGIAHAKSTHAVDTAAVAGDGQRIARVAHAASPDRCHTPVTHFVM